MPIRILVNGAFGRMGQITVQAINECPDFQLVGQTGRGYDLKKSIKDSNAQVVIDFTSPESVYDNTSIIIDMGVHPVIGTSGLLSDQVNSFKERCKKLKLGGIIAPNFSLGAILMMKYAAQVAHYMPYAEIIEMHHNEKIDSPSGTAIRSAEMIAEASTSINAQSKKSHETLVGARGASHRNIPIHSIRSPGIIAYQEIIFSNLGETFSLRHNIIDRKCFMPAICLACEKVMQLDQLVYGLEEII